MRRWFVALTTMASLLGCSSAGSDKDGTESPDGGIAAGDVTVETDSEDPGDATPTDTLGEALETEETFEPDLPPEVVLAPCTVAAECNDLDPCTVDLCEPDYGCVNTPKSCTDGNACTIDNCRASDGQCLHNSLDCTDENACTEESCDTESGCVYAVIDCDDGAACTADGCNPQTGCNNKVKDCDDGDPCTDDKCSEPIGCSHSPSADPNCCVANFQCDDGLPCTLDECANYSCTFAPIPGLTCCDVDEECADENDCTENLCTDGLCQFQPAGPECCMIAGDCEDGDGCTTEDCLDYACIYQPVPDCCHEAADCDDQEVCTTDECTPAGTNFGFCNNKATLDCCHDDAADCDDDNACTLDSCPGMGAICTHELSESCCLNVSECDDEDPCTQDSCLDNECNHISICCDSNADCNDNDVCTTDECTPADGGSGFCSNTAVPNCCHDDDAECNDGNLCTTDSCPGMGKICTNNWAEDCCLAASDCDNDDPCTQDACLGNKCDHVDVCCDSSAECDDNEVCTTDECTPADANSAFCSNEAVLDCCHDDDAECNDGNLCTIDSCPGMGEVCTNKWSENCCLALSDCDDEDPCTQDSCLDNECIHVEICCDSNADCDDGDDVCTTETCDNNFCVYEPTGIEGCCNIPLFEDDFQNNLGWDYGPNWNQASAAVSEGSAYGNPDPALDHTGSDDNFVAGVVVGGNAPTTEVHASYFLTSPSINTAGVENLTLTFWRWLNSDYDPYMTNNIEVFDGATWVEIWATGPAPGTQDSVWTYQEFDVTAHANSNFQVRFGYAISSNGVYDVSSWNIDDVKVFSKGNGVLCCKWPSDCQTTEAPDAACIGGSCVFGG